MKNKSFVKFIIWWFKHESEEVKGPFKKNYEEVIDSIIRKSFKNYKTKNINSEVMNSFKQKMIENYKNTKDDRYTETYKLVTKAVKYAIDKGLIDKTLYFEFEKLRQVTKKDTSSISAKSKMLESTMIISKPEKQKEEETQEKPRNFIFFISDFFEKSRIAKEKRKQEEREEEERIQRILSTPVIIDPPILPVDPIKLEKDIKSWKKKAELEEKYGMKIKTYTEDFNFIIFED